MAVTFDFVLHPQGELMMSMFPDGDLDVNACVWFSEAETKTADMETGETQDAAIKAWVYYRAFTAIANSISIKPTSGSYYGSERSETWGADRVKFYNDKARYYLDQFNTFAQPVVTNQPVYYSTVATRLAVW